MNAELGTHLRVAGLLRSPDHEGALAHLDVARGFALVARGATSLTDVIDPTIWVREKLTVALLPAPGDPGEPPLRRVIGALRALHAELIRRPPRDRAWVSVLAALFHGGEGVLLSAGDCACFRYRDGLLSRLRRADDAGAGTLPPRGALGSEPQVRIDVVPLRPRPGDLYVASTRHLKEGELSALARSLASARDGAELLRAGVEGSTDRGRLAIRILEAEEDATLTTRAEELWQAARDGSGESAPEAPENGAPPDALVLSPLIPDEAIEEDEEALGPGEVSAEAMPSATLEGEPSADDRYGAPAFLRGAGSSPPEDAERPPEDTEDAEPGDDRAESDSQDSAAAAADEAALRRPRALAQVEDAPPWYEPLALWVGGALAIIALALLVRAILPGILGEKTASVTGAAPAVAKGVVDFFSDPPGALVRVDGERLGKTPIAAAALGAGTHRVEMDWGPAGTWRDTIEVTRGERLTVHPAIFGSMNFRSSDPSRMLDVYLDGAYAGTTPLTLSRVVVGRHLVRFGGAGAGGTTQEIDVLRDAPAEIVGNAGPMPDSGRLTIRSALLTDVGFEAGRKDPVWIDGVARGATPLSLTLTPGAHSARVVRRGFPAQITVVDVKAGGDHYVTAEFGARSEQPLQFSPPSALSISNPLPVTVTLPDTEWNPDPAVWLFAAAPHGSFQGKRMTRLEGGARVYATLVPAEVLRNSAARVRVYFKAAATDGRELYSEIFTVPVRP